MRGGGGEQQSFHVIVVLVRPVRGSASSAKVGRDAAEVGS